MPLNRKDLLGIAELEPQEIQEILDMAAPMKQIIAGGQKKTADLAGKAVVTLFYENSTRTRLSFEMASKYMGASAANIAASSSSVAKGETLLDTGRTIDRMGTDVLVIRHPLSGAPHMLARSVRASVVNAGDGMHEHPTQALLDLYTMREKKGRIAGLEAAIVGDVLHSRVARSNMLGLLKLGARVRVAGPLTMLPRGIEAAGARVCRTVDEALEGADVVMGLRLQLERQKSGLFPNVREYARFFGIDGARLARAKPDVLVLHPGPVNRGIEMTSSVIDSESSAIDEQVANGVAVRMAILKLLAERSA